MYLQQQGRGSWSLTELRAGKGREGLSGHAAAQETGGWGRGGRRGCREGAEEELYKLQQPCCGALGNVGPPQECSNPLLPLYPLSFTKTNSLLLQSAINNAI